MRVIGYLSARSPDDTTHLVAAFRRGKAVSSNQNVTIEFRWALGQYDRLPALATELVRRPVAILATTGGEPAAREDTRRWLERRLRKAIVESDRADERIGVFTGATGQDRRE